jgi:hypothetical protein
VIDTLFVGTPFHDANRHYRWVLAVESCRQRWRCRVEQVTGSFLSKSRDLITQIAIESGASHALFVDSDMVWSADDAVRLEALGADFAAATYVSRDGQGRPMWDTTAGDDMRVRWVGAGFMLFRVEALARFANESPPERVYLAPGGFPVNALWTADRIAGLEHESEDGAFCRRWRESGREIVVDPKIRVRHIGEAIY